MTFVSYEFAVFVVVCLGLYWGVTRAFGTRIWYGRLRVLMLSLFSALFLILAGGLFSLAWYGVSAFSVWAGALAMERCRGRREALAMERCRGRREDPALAREQSQSSKGNPPLASEPEGLAGAAKAGRIYGWVLALNLILLAVFRYSNFPGYTVQELCWLTGRQWQWEPFSLAAPVAISFYTLTLAGYLTEVYWEAVPAERSFLRLALFGGFFPQMAMGPVARYQKLSRTLYGDGPSMTGEELSGALIQIFWGLFQKLVISERLAVLVNTIYGDPATYSGSYLVFAAACFGFQLYTDFGGAIEIALGVARLFGVRLETNFCQPFFSRSIAEFWRRWHRTLGGWFKDFVMYPLLKSQGFQKLGRMARKHLGKKTGKKVPTAVGLVVVWFLLGLWHGGKWTFIIGSGLYHAVLMGISLFAEPLYAGFYRKTGLNPDHFLWVTFQRLRTFVLVSVGFVFFRSDSLAEAVGIFRGMFSGDLGLFGREGLLSLGLSRGDLLVLAGSMAVLLGVSMRKELAGKDGEREDKKAGQKAADGNIRVPEKGRRQDTGIPGGEETAPAGTSVFWGNFRRLALCLGMIYLLLLFGWYGPGYDPAAFIYSRF